MDWNPKKFAIKLMKKFQVAVRFGRVLKPTFDDFDAKCFELGSMRVEKLRKCKTAST
jgi:hypothetical protein